MKWLIRSSSVDGKLILHLARKSEPTSWYSVAMTAGIAAQNTQEYNWRKETGLHDFQFIVLYTEHAWWFWLEGRAVLIMLMSQHQPTSFCQEISCQISNLKSQSEIHHPTTPYVT